MSQPFGISCKGGLNTNLNQLEMLSQPGLATILQNFEVDPDGGYRRINGYTHYGAESHVRPVPGSSVLGVMPYGNGAVVVVGDGVYYSDDGTSWLQVNKDTSHSGMTEAALAGATVLPRTGQGQAQFALMKASTGHTANNFGSLTIATGPNKMAHFHIDGTDPSTRLFVYEEISTPTAGKYVEIHDRHLCVVDAVNEPNTVYYSATNDDKDFVGIGSGSIAIADRITGIKSFRDDLFIFCANSIHKLSNINDAASISVAQITGNVGCLSGYSIQEIGGDLLFLSPDGIRTVAGTARIGDVELSSVSRQIQSVIVALANRIDEYVVSSVVLRSKSQYRLFYSRLDDSVLESKGVIGTLTANGFEWSTTSGIQAPAIGANFDGDGVEAAYHADHIGYVYNHDTGNSFIEDDIERNIYAVYETPSFDFGDIGTRKTMKYVRISFTPEGAVNPYLRLRYDYKGVDTPQPQDYTLDYIPPPAIFGISTFGIAVFGGTEDPMVRQTVEGSGNTCSFRISSEDITPPYAVNGLYIDYMPSGRR